MFYDRKYPVRLKAPKRGDLTYFEVVKLHDAAFMRPLPVVPYDHHRPEGKRRQRW